MVYKKPKMLLLELEEEDVVTLSIDNDYQNPDNAGDGDDADWGDGW